MSSVLNYPLISIVLDASPSWRGFCSGRTAFRLRGLPGWWSSAPLPVVGIVAYLLLGEVNIGRRRAARVREALARMPDI